VAVRSNWTVLAKVAKISASTTTPLTPKQNPDTILPRVARVSAASCPDASAIEAVNAAGRTSSWLLRQPDSRC
jgi:hypothetical protein